MASIRMLTLVLTPTLSLLVACATASAVSRGYEIHTADVTCDEANRTVHQALEDMGMQVTDFRKARPGAPGYAEASRGPESGGSMSGRVDVSCDSSGVHMVPDQGGFLGAQEFERGFFLSATGRADLVVEREGRYSTGTLHKRAGADTPGAIQQVSTRSAGAAEAARLTAQAETDVGENSPFAEDTSGGVEVQVELVRGFATVLDFEANVSAVGILPVKITVENKTARSYDFNPRDVVLRKDGTADRTEAMAAAEAVKQLKSGKGKAQAEEEKEKKDGSALPTGGAPADVEGLGDVEAATRLLPDREIKKARLEPGKSVSGYLYFPAGEYDRARVTMTDVATGETEGFLVEF